MPIARPCIRRPARNVAGLALLIVGATAMGMLSAPTARGQEGTRPTAEAGPATHVYPVRRIVLRYEGASKDLPPTEGLRPTTVTLQRRGGAWHAPDGEGPTVTRPIDEVADLAPHRFHGSALRAISLALVRELNARGYIGVTVRPDPGEVDPRGRDRREDSAAMTFVIDVARVARRRTLASGDRVDDERGINHPAHERIKTHSPLREGEPVRKDRIDRYLHWLNRHPSRRVDVALGSAVTPGDAVVDYLVTENKPWLVYAQFSNTGTETTGQWRQRAGFVHHQLTGHDDILSIDLATSSFEGTHSINASYERPTPFAPRLRLRAFGGYSAFEAEDVAVFNIDFDGEQTWFGLDGRWNFFQAGPLFLDLHAGIRYQSIEVNNRTARVSGEDDFVLPHVGIGLERETDAASSRAMVDLAVNLPGAAGTDEETLFQLGRENVEDDFALLTWDLSQSVYLEPLLWRNAWRDASTPRSSTLAHEVALRFSGQHTFGERVVPQLQGVVGGLRTVRGYDESTAAADTTLVFSAEYRLHIPQLLPIDEDPTDTTLFGEPFRVAPAEVYGRADWDLVAKGFVDIGRTFVADASIGEGDETLVGAGAGVELVFKRNLRIQADWGVALEEANEVGSGNHRFHFAATIMY